MTEDHLSNEAQRGNGVGQLEDRNFFSSMLLLGAVGGATAYLVSQAIGFGAFAITIIGVVGGMVGRFAVEWRVEKIRERRETEAVAAKAAAANSEVNRKIAEAKARGDFDRFGK